MRFLTLVLILFAAGVAPFFTEDNILVDKQKSDGLLNQSIAKITYENNLLMQALDDKNIYRVHRIEKRGANKSVRSGRKGRKRRMQKRNLQPKNYQDDTNYREKQNHFSRSRDEQSWNLNNILDQRNDERHMSSQPDTRIEATQSRTKSDGILMATNINADRISAKTMNADSVVADKIYADQIHGETIIVTSKQNQPFLSEFTYRRPRTEIQRSPGTGYYRGQSRFTNSDYGDPFSNTDNSENFWYKQTSDSLSNFHQQTVVKKYAGNRDLKSPKANNRPLENIRDLYKYNSRPDSIYQSETTIIDTHNHPFISFQNGYVKRQKILKPLYENGSGMYGNTRTRRQRYGFHPSNWQ